MKRIVPEYYEILGVDKSADSAKIKASYRKLSKTFHPDVYGDDAQFKKITEAYDILSDSQKRADYDNILNSRNEDALNTSEPKYNYQNFNEKDYNFEDIATSKIKSNIKNYLKILFKKGLDLILFKIFLPLIISFGIYHNYLAEQSKSISKIAFLVIFFILFKNRTFKETITYWRLRYYKIYKYEAVVALGVSLALLYTASLEYEVWFILGYVLVSRLINDSYGKNKRELFFKNILKNKILK